MIREKDKGYTIAKLVPLKMDQKYLEEKSFKGIKGASISEIKSLESVDFKGIPRCRNYQPKEISLGEGFQL